MVNPNKQIRKAIVDGLRALLGLKVYENSIPLDVELDNHYLLVNSQTKRPTSTAKGCFDFMCGVTVSIISVSEKGFNGSIDNDYTEEVVFTFLQSFKTEGVKILNRRFIDTVSTVVELPDHTVNQTNVVYDIWTAN